MSSDFDDLRALFLNASLERDPADSHTRRLLERAASVMRSQGTTVEILHLLSHDIPAGMHKDLTDQGLDRDDWPAIQQQVLDADILVIGTPIWLGVKSSVATLAIERLYAYSGDRNDKGQYVYYGRTAGCVVTGNEDGAKSVARDVLYALQHIGYTIPPQADCAWLDGNFDLTAAGNAEILCNWLVIAAGSGYEPAFGRIRTFLGEVGRMKYLKPLYTALHGNDATRALAAEIFAASGGGYHPIARGGIERVLAA